MTKLLLTLAIIGVALTGCATSYYGGDSAFIRRNYAAANALTHSASTTLNKADPIMVATIVSIDNLENSSRLGRAISEQLSSALSKQGYRPVELKLRNSLFMKQDTGELMLSREVREVAQVHKTSNVLIGTYSASNENVYVNIKIVDVANNNVIAAHDYTIPHDREIFSLLYSGAYPYPIPVR